MKRLRLAQGHWYLNRVSSFLGRTKPTGLDPLGDEEKSARSAANWGDAAKNGLSFNSHILRPRSHSFAIDRDEKGGDRLSKNQGTIAEVDVGGRKLTSPCPRCRRGRGAMDGRKKEI